MRRHSRRILFLSVSFAIPGTTAALAMHSDSSAAAASSPSAKRPQLSLVADPVTGEAFGKEAKNEKYQDIHSVPASALHGGGDLTMVLPVDPAGRRVLLEVPNGLGWRYHFGCRISDDGNGDGDGVDRCNNAAKALAESLRREPSGLRLREAGLMLFTFLGAVHPPMRVRVYVTTIPVEDGNASDSEGQPRPPPVGKYYGYDEVPYGEMWADDVIWMPSLIRNCMDENFELHCVFGGGPGRDSALLDYGYRTY